MHKKYPILPHLGTGNVFLLEKNFCGSTALLEAMVKGKVAVFEGNQNSN
jgi:hypothetical protein